MKLVKILLLFVIVGSIDSADAHRILGIYGFPVKSHFVMINQLFKGLARKGHQVDVISPFPQTEKYPNYTQIITLPNSVDLTTFTSFQGIRKFTQTLDMSSVGKVAYQVCQHLGIPEILNLARNPPKDPPYDVIITQMVSYHCFMIFGHLWNIPVILVSTSYLYPWMHDMIGNPENIAFTPNNLFPIPEGNTFWSRFYNTYMFYYVKLSFLYYSTNQNELLQKYFGPNVPTIRELERSVSLVLINTYFPVNGVEPTAKGIIEVGGLHVQNDTSKFDNNLKKWLDQSNEGVIYFSLGSIIRIEIFPKETLEIIFDSLKKLKPMRVLMRVAKPEELTVKIPSNFYTLPWIPQEQVLQHPNVKLFITHGGLLGTQESIFYGVPMLCLPVFADQWTNTRNYLSKKIAVMADIMSLTRETFDNAVNEILNNPVYKENIKRLSKSFRDRPLSAMDTAAFWVDFVVRNGKDSLRSPVMDLTWWQVALLDVIAVSVVGLLIIISMFIFTIKILITVLRRIFYKKGTKISKRKKRN